MISRQQRRHEERKGGQGGDPSPAKPITSKELIEKAGMRDPADRLNPDKWGGKLNIYTCDGCRAHIVTRDVDEGVTPFMLPSSDYCPNKCGGMGQHITMVSSMYRVWDQSMIEDFQWYRPVEGVHEIPLSMAHHVQQGGLLIRKREG